jgi:purine-cytosine permease-like protein
MLKYFNGMDVSFFAGFLAAAVSYYLLARTEKAEKSLDMAA